MRSGPKSAEPMPWGVFSVSSVAVLLGSMDGTLLETDQEELVVEAVRMVHANPGPNEHAMFKTFNADLIANPPGHA